MTLINPKFIPESSGLYLVGGCVRDLLLGRPTTDYDLAAKGDAEKIAGAIASAAGSRVVVMGGAGKCVYRIVTDEGNYDVSDIKGPDIKSDLLRRDFTVNAMAVNTITGELIDPAGGRKDLSGRLIRMVWPGAFDEDSLRLLRALRMAAVLNFSIDSETLAALSSRSEKIAETAGERVREEWIKMLQSPFSAKLINMAESTGLLYGIFPELRQLKGCPQNRHHRFDAFEHTIAVYRVLEKMLHENRPFMYSGCKNTDLLNSAGGIGLIKHAALLHDIGKPMTRSVDDKGDIHFYNHDSAGANMVRDINLRLRFSNRENNYTFFLVKNHLRPLFLFILQKADKLKTKTVTRFFIRTAPLSPDLLLMATADFAGKDSYAADEFTDFAQNLIRQYLNQHLPASRRPRLITGRDLIEIYSLTPSPLFSEILEKIEEMRLAGLLKNRDQALEYTEKLLQRKG